jgi:protein ImuB
VARLIELKLEALAAMEDAGFGFEAVGLAVIHAEPMPARQIEFSAGDDGDRAERCAALIDTLRQRLGPASVRRFAPVASHLPERAEILPPVDGEVSTWSASQQARPLLLLPRAEPAEVTALVPDGPPRRFSWRGTTYDVAGSQGPERIGAEWWRTPHSSARPREGGDPGLDSRFRGNERQQAPTRDYYLVEDWAGHRFWLYREGLYGHETAAARWFVQGLFA